jgi:uncharacterized protein (DUF433 family)
MSRCPECPANVPLENYPGITQEDIQACLGYASQLLHEEKVYPLKVS